MFPVMKAVSSLVSTKLDPDYDLIMDEQLENNEWSDRIEAAKKAKDGQRVSLMAQIMDKQLFNKLKNVKTSQGQWTIARAINTGTMNPTSFVGCHAGDLESYTVFKELFDPIIEAYHVGFKVSENKHITDLDVNKISEDLSESAKSKIISTRIRVARNLASFPLNPAASKQNRIEIANLMESVFGTLEGDFSGSFFRHTTMTQQEQKQLIDDHYMFRGKDAMQASSGYHQFWPHGRGIFHNKEKTFLLWINEGDHLRIISMEKGGDVKKVFARLSQGIREIEQGLQRIQQSQNVFMTHPVFGCITCCPTNLGTGMRGSVHILVPQLIKKYGLEGIDQMARKLNCQARGSSGEHSEVIDRIDISNWRRLGFKECDLVQDMIRCANYLSDLEDQEINNAKL